MVLVCPATFLSRARPSSPSDKPIKSTEEDGGIITIGPCANSTFLLSSVVISCFAIIILSIIGSLYRSKHHEFVGGVDDPDNTSEVSSTIFTAVIVYAVCSWAADSTPSLRFALIPCRGR
ncbi:hypothetical protein F4823DRAFT_86866 [Ustulina deusta]|nr:hypothetical protein F4823DRAFT_86866 [Ustulina deusta]